MEKKIEYKLTALNTQNHLIDIIVHECQHCHELVPKVGNCPLCGTAYNHLQTIENFQTGFLHYIYECSGCPEDRRKAQKVIKPTEVVDDDRLNLRKNLKLRLSP